MWFLGWGFKFESGFKKKLKSKNVFNFIKCFFYYVYVREKWLWYL